MNNILEKLLIIFKEKNTINTTEDIFIKKSNEIFKRHIKSNESQEEILSKFPLMSIFNYIIDEIKTDEINFNDFIQNDLYNKYKSFINKIMFLYSQAS
jgi:hypothetical protein